MAAEAEAEAEAKQMQAKVTQARRELDAVVTERRRFQNGGAAKMEHAAADARRVELEVKVAQLMAENALLVRDTERAGFSWERARRATEAMRQELGLTS